ncbi:hypothetical protein BJY00DRAFT_258130 [Aspergillus carlsbadensis]|nr:hypothetical protein BJY00DRAFT_258130 [Aspergillus carlsbadensis]
MIALNTRWTQGFAFMLPCNYPPARAAQFCSARPRPLPPIKPSFCIPSRTASCLLAVLCSRVLRSQFETCASRCLLHGHRWFAVRLRLRTYLVLDHADTWLSCKRPRAPFLRAHHLLAQQMRPVISHANPTSTNEVKSSAVMSNSVTRTPQGDAVSNDSGIRLLLVRMMYSAYWPVGRRGLGNLLVVAWQKHHQSLASHQQTLPQSLLKCRIQPTPT